MIEYTQKRVVWNIEEKPGGGFLARSENSAETIEAPTRAEILAKIRERIKVVSPELAGLDLSQLPLDQPGSVVKLPTTAKLTFSLFRSGGDKPAATFQAQLGGSPSAIESDEEKPARFQARLNAVPGAIEPEGNSLLSALWKAAVLVGIAIIIWLLLTR